MQFFSTRDRNRVVSASQAIAQGLSDEGGLFVPQSFPQVDVQAICGLEYPEMAAAIVGQYLTDYSQQFLAEAAKATYGEAFGGKAGYLAPVSDSVYSLELWHGPTCAFKDYALQLMPKLLVEAKKNLNRTEKTLILVATSGDTGKAALDGYHDIPGVEIAVFFPTGGTSEIQRLQMATQEGENVAVYAVRGNFDDAQTGVKRVFGDGAIAAELAKRNIRLSSANSINWGRLVPQIVYYFAAYARLLKAGTIAFGDKVDFCVPTGNFGDILAGYYAKQMGLPVGKLVCASNENNVLTDFLTTGTYTAKREFFKTTSPSMDILVSSNLERLLYHVTGSDTEVAALMKSLAETGSYTVRPETLLDHTGELRVRLEQRGAGGRGDPRPLRTGRLPLRYPHGGGLPCGRAAQAGRRAHGGALHRIALQVPAQRAGSAGPDRTGQRFRGHAAAGRDHRPHRTGQLVGAAPEGRALQHRHRPGADRTGGAELSGVMQR